MSTIDTRPEVVDVFAYAGDTLTINVTVPAGYADGLEWSAQVRSDRNSSVVDAQFSIVAAGTPDQWTLTLSAEDSRALGLKGTEVTEYRKTIRRYVGAWDVQIAGPGGTDPVRTLAQGDLTLDLDVTKE